MNWFKTTPSRRNTEDIETANDVISSQSHIKFYDDMTDELLTPSEIKQLEENANSPFLPIIIDNSELERTFTQSQHEAAYQKCNTSKKGKIRKMRIPISSKLKQYVLLRSQGLCEYCNNTVGKHIHHIDGIPYHNNENNLILICQKCHKEVHKEMKEQGSELIISQVKSKIVNKSSKSEIDYDEYD